MNEPLLIFWAFTVRDTFQHGLDLHKTNTEAIELENHLLDKYLYTDDKLLYATVCRSPGGTTGFLAKAEQLFSHFHGPVFIFHREIPMYGGGAVYPPNVFVNYPLHMLLDTICIRVSDQNKSRMAAAMGSPPRFVRRVRQDDTDADLQRALLASEEEHARALLLKRPPELKENMNDWLKESEPACPGFAQCSVCFEKKATICIVDCGHQALCDDCVPKLNHHRCVICQTDIQRIVRPIYSLVMEQQQQLPVAATSKKRRRICIKK